MNTLSATIDHCPTPGGPHHEDGDLTVITAADGRSRHIWRPWRGLGTRTPAWRETQEVCTRCLLPDCERILPGRWAAQCDAAERDA